MNFHHLENNKEKLHIFQFFLMEWKYLWHDVFFNDDVFCITDI